MIEWQPIETAPKNQYVLGGWTHHSLGWLWAKAHYIAGSTAGPAYWICDNGGEPTHWLQLPAPPQAADAVDPHADSTGKPSTREAKSLDSSNYDTLRSHVLTIVEEMRGKADATDNWWWQEVVEVWADRLEEATRGDRSEP